MESNFGVIKNLFFHFNKQMRDLDTDDFIKELTKLISWYNQERPRSVLGGMSPVRFRVYVTKHISFRLEKTERATIVTDTQKVG
jgi:transposase InsO family protein